MPNYVIFYKLNPAFVLTEAADSEEDAVAQVSKRMGIDEKFIEAMEKGVRNEYGAIV